MLIRVAYSDKRFHELKSLEDIDDFASKELLNRLKTPKGYRAVFGTSIGAEPHEETVGLERDGSYCWAEKPLFSKEKYGSKTVTVQIYDLIKESNQQIKNICDTFGLK
ncbi:hypothetical protein L6303_03325 [archaeon]|nr:hypothetical protein [Nanoarchaeota archaeon]MBU4300394.1 hypothetical protein [Nanoarchaeota archaeon]MBU4451346.1 hypothetical protein [Nanoarchaeota archaeon]MCG2723749.1 hypothetical protein [archaeon]